MQYHTWLLLSGFECKITGIKSQFHLLVHGQKGQKKKERKRSIIQIQYQKRETVFFSVLDFLKKLFLWDFLNDFMD